MCVPGRSKPVKTVHGVPFSLSARPLRTAPQGGDEPANRRRLTANRQRLRANSPRATPDRCAPENQHQPVLGPAVSDIFGNLFPHDTCLQIDRRIGGIMLTPLFMWDAPAPLSQPP